MRALHKLKRMPHVVQAVSQAPAFLSVTALWDREVMNLPPLVKWSAYWVTSVSMATYLDGSLASTRAKSDEHQSYQKVCSEGTMRIKSVITDCHALHRMVSGTDARSFPTCSPKVSQLPKYERHA